LNHSEGKFNGAGERSVYFQCWEPESVPRAVLLVAHGAGEHSARYQPLAQFMTGYGFAVAALDHNGHGYSEGKPGHVNSFDEYLYDLATFHRQVAAQYAGLPMFLFGHSMGGLITSNYLLHHQKEFVGGILSGPAIKTELQPGQGQMLLLRLLALLVPRLGMLKLNADGISRDPEVVRKYIEDPLVFHGKMTARMLRELFAGMSTIQAGAARITLPMLLLHGGADVMTAPEGSRFLYEHIGSSDKTLKIYPGLYHEILNEPERAEVLAHMLEWVETRLGAAG
jgi:alpha-beta hydrolase superfamily lysophospholipase